MRCTYSFPKFSLSLNCANLAPPKRRDIVPPPKPWPLMPVLQKKGRKKLRDGSAPVSQTKKN